MKLAFLFAGQGSQKAGMGKDFYENRPEFAKILDAVNLDFDIKDLFFNRYIPLPHNIQILATLAVKALSCSGMPTSPYSPEIICLNFSISSVS